MLSHNSNIMTIGGNIMYNMCGKVLNFINE